MSAAARILLLLILLFLAFWAYQFREREVQVLLSAFREPPPAASRPAWAGAAVAGASIDGAAAIAGPFAGASPVERVIDPRETQLRAVWSAPDPPAPPPPEPEPEPEPQPDAGPELAGDAAPKPAEIAEAEKPLQTEAPAETEKPGETVNPAPPPPDAGPAAVEFTYQVQERDTLWKIARRFLGSGLRHREIQSWNPGKVAADGAVAAGVQLVIRGVQPPTPAPAPVPAPVPVPAPQAQAPKAQAPPAPAPQVPPPAQPPRQITHRVKGKETLAALARKYYRGDSDLWTRIYEANRDVLDDPHALQVGLVLRIPDPAGAGRGTFR